MPVRSGRALATLVALALVAGAAQQWWTGASERRAVERLAAVARPGDIRMISSETCPFCEAARRTMTAHGVPFDECFIERDADCRALYQATQSRGTPTLIVRGQVLLGFDPQRVGSVLSP